MGRLSDLYNDLSQQQTEAESQYIRTTTPGLREADPQPKPKQVKEDQPGLASDAWSSFGMGAGQLVKGAGWLFGSDSLKEVGQDTVDYWETQLSDAQREANQERFIEDDYSVGEGATNPRTWMGTIMQSIPMMVPGVGASGGVARLGLKAGLSRGGTTAAAAGTGSTVEGATIGALVGEEVESAIMEAPIEELQNSPYFQDLIDAGKEPETARQMVAEKASEGAGMQSGVLGAVLGVAFNKFVSDAVTGNLSTRLLKETGRGATEGIVTEAAQTGVEARSRQSALNEHLGRPYDVPGALNEVVGGMGAGGIMGGAVGAGGALNGSNTPEPPEPMPEVQPEQPAPQPQQASPAQPSRLTPGAEPAFDDSLDNIGERYEQAINQPPSIAGMGVNLGAGQQSDQSPSQPLSEQVGTEQDPQLVYDQEGVQVRQLDDSRFEARSTDSDLVAEGRDMGEARRRLQQLIERNQPQAPVLQNRDRSDPGYVRQMEDIANNPDYDQVSASKTPDAGAPMVFPQGTAPPVPEMNIGRSETITMADGQGGTRKIRAQYAVVDADDLKASHSADGRQNEAYGRDGLIALNNGRTAGLQEAYNRGTAEAYKQAMKEDAQNLGIDPAAIDPKRKPVLVRLFDGAQLEGIDDPGAASNERMSADLSPVEQAQTDARKITPDVLAALNPGDPTGSGNTDFVRSAISAIAGDNRKTDLRDRNGLLTAAGQKRVRGALVERAYSDQDLTRELVEATDSDLKTLGDALTEVAGRWALMRERANEGSINPDMDITDALVGAVNMIRKSRQEGRSLKDLASQVDAFAGEADQMAVKILHLFYHGANYGRIRAKDAIAGALQGYIDSALATSPGPDMFGGMASPQDTLENQRGQIEGESPQETAPGVQPDGADNRESGPQGEGRSRSAGRETDAKDGRGEAEVTPDQTPGLELEAQTEEHLAEQARTREEAEQAESRARREKEQRAEADRQADNFTLTGSDRTADVAMAAGQDDLLAQAESTTGQESRPADTAPSQETEAESGQADQEAEQPTKPIEDFGEKIEGARKDYASKMKAAKEKDVAAVPLSESWPEPDYQKLIESGADPVAVGMAHAARDAVPPKPRKGWKLKGWVRQVEALRNFTESVVEGEFTVADLREHARKDGYKTLEPQLFNLAELYAAVGHDKSLKGLRFSNAHFTIFDGKKGSFDKWLIERTAKTNAFGNMPRQLVAADSKEQAIEQFRKIHQSLNAKGKEPKTTRFDIYSSRYDKNDVFIGKKIGKDIVRIKEGFDSVKEAREYLNTKQDVLERILGKMKNIPDHRKATNSPRVGVDHRNGGDVTPEAFAETFGFRGVQFGNYVEQGRRQQDLNEAYDGLMDLAGILNIPAKALSLNGELGLAFGARGKGGKTAPKAHYEPGNIVINLTKKSGAGSLAHEWFHALDNYFARDRGGKPADRYATRGQPDMATRPEVAEAFRNIRQTVNRIRLRERSRKLDKMRTKVYWSTDVEMTARAFESYVIEKLKDQEGANDYLANIVSEEYWKASEALGMEDSDSYPYPEAAEIPEIRAAYDNLFEVIETREGDDGNVLLFSRTGEPRFARNDPRFMFAGPQAETSDLSMLEQARNMEQGNSSQTAIRNQTGWMRGADGKWRYEINDSDAKLTQEIGNGTRLTTVGNLLDHPRLFAAYPNLEDTSVLLDSSMEDGSYGYFSPGIGITLNINRTDDQVLSTLLHEIQHAIQSAEGFARGGNSDQEFTSKIKDALSEQSDMWSQRLQEWFDENEDMIRYVEDQSDLATYALMYQSAKRLMNYANSDRPSGVLRNIRNEMGWVYSEKVRQDEDLRRRFDELDRNWYNLPKRHKMRERNLFLRDHAGDAAQLIREAIPREVIRQFDTDTRKLPSMIKALERNAEKARKQLEPMRDLQRKTRAAETVAKEHRFSGPFSVYQALAGEIEARNTQARQKMTDEQRRRTGPKQTADVSQERAIVLLHGREGATIEVPYRMESTGYRRTPGSRIESLTAEEARTIANDLMKGWKGRPGVTVADRISEFPADLRAAIRLAKAEGDMRAVFWNDHVYILAPRIPSRAALEETLLHEVVGHYGLRKMMGKDLAPLLNQVYLKFAGTDQAKTIIQNYFPDGDFNASKPDHRAEVAEELFAHIAETRQHQKLWNRIVAAVRNGLRKLGFTLELSETDLLNILKGAQRTVEKGGIAQPSVYDTYFRRAYHGTPHRFDKFSLEAIGTGEGAQAYGWGLYFAGKRDIADYYRTEVSKVSIAEKFLDDLPQDADFDEFVEWLEDADIPSNEREFMQALVDDDLLGFEYPAQAINAALKQGNLENYDPSPRLVEAVKNVGNLYEVEIPDDSDLLDYDKRLSDQPPGITDAVRAITDEYHGEGTFDSWMEANEEGGDYREWRDNLMEEVEDRDLSMRLNEKGVPGLRYLDADSRIDSADGQTHNYVIWDDSAVTVQAVNDEIAQAEAYFSRNQSPVIQSAERFLEMQGKQKAEQLLKKAQFVYRKNITDRLAAYDRADAGDQQSLSEIWLDYSDQLDSAAREEADAADLTFSELADQYTRDIQAALNEEGGPQADAKDLVEYAGRISGEVESFLNALSGERSEIAFKAKSALSDMAGPANPDIRFSRAGNKLDAAATHFNDLTDEQRTALGKIAPRTPKEKAQDWLRERTDRWQTKVRQGMVDRFAALKDVDEAVHGRDVIEGSTASSSWVLAQMSGSAAGALQSMLTTSRIKLNRREKVITTQDGTEGLNDTLKQLGSAAEIERFFGWIAGNRSRRLMAEGRENLFEPGEVEALAQLNRGTTDSGQSRGVLYGKVFREFQQYRDDVLAIAEQAGIITPEQRETWANEFYVPFYRLAEDDSTFTGPKATGGISRQEAYKKLKGGTRPLNDLLENTMMNFHHLLQASLKNQAAIQAVDNSQDMGIAREVAEADRDTLNSTFILRDGQKIWYEIDDPLVFKAVTALAHPGMNSTAMKVMRSFKRLFTNLTTTTPQFVVANLLRDSMQASATSEVSKNILKNMAQGSKVYGDPKIRAKMMASGGSFSFGHLYGENADELRLRITGGLAQADILRSPSMVPDAIRGLWRKWNEMTEFTENINRAAIFEQNQDRGELYAAFKSRDLMNFSQHGAWPAMRILIDVVPFLNARLQGLDKIYRSGVKPGIRTAMGQGTASEKQQAARFWSVTGTLALASIALYLNNRDDEEYQKLEEWQKDTYWYLRLSDDHAIFIPKPFEVGAIATMAERMTEQAVSDTATGKLFVERLSHMLLDTFSFSPVPQMFQPALDIYSNYDAFTGRPIESMGMERLSPSLRRRNSTTALATGLSAATESVFGADGRMTLSPVQIDHAIQGYFGSVGAWVVGITDTIWRTANGKSEPSNFWYENQPIRRFYKNLGDEDRYTRYGTVFYEALKETGRVYSDIKEYIELGQTDKARELYRQNRNKLAYRQILNRAQRKLSEINNAMQNVRRLDASSEYKRRELDRLRALKNRIQEVLGRKIEQINASDS